jgi:hypothetical protein
MIDGMTLMWPYIITPRVPEGFESGLLVRVGGRVAPGNSHQL